MPAKYDHIGKTYSSTRQTDPRIEAQIHAHLQGAKRIINIGAGTGSYEPEHIDLIAVEPSVKMIAQRKPDAHPVIQASAEQLPFEDNSFTHAITVLSMHHWSDREKAYREISRVTTDHFVAVSWDPAFGTFWLTRDYLPEVHTQDDKNFPTLDELKEHFDNVESTPLLIPHDCQDGFLAAYWRRPEAYLDQQVRNSMSVCVNIKDDHPGLIQLKEDLDSGTWAEKNRDILDQDALDAGYVVITGKIRK